jgi:hypothetical protein
MVALGLLLAGGLLVWRTIHPRPPSGSAGERAAATINTQLSQSPLLRRA